MVCKKGLHLVWNFYIMWGSWIDWFLNDCATPQLDTVTLQPAPSDTVTIRPMSCCSLATQLQLYDQTPDLSSRVFSWGPNCHCNDSPRTGHFACDN